MHECVSECVMSYVHDVKVSVASKYISRSDLRAAEEETEFDRVITYLTKAMRTPKTVSSIGMWVQGARWLVRISFINLIRFMQEDFSADHVNSLEGIDPKDILSLHLLHFKKGRKM
jgi:hypothetical protein